MKRWTSLILLLVLLATPVLAAKTGDPLDGNDRTMSEVEDACAWYFQYPHCNWCWQVCLYAMMAEDYTSGGITWQWGD